MCNFVFWGDAWKESQEFEVRWRALYESPKSSTCLRSSWINKSFFPFHLAFVQLKKKNTVCYFLLFLAEQAGRTKPWIQRRRIEIRPQRRFGHLRSRDTTHRNRWKVRYHTLQYFMYEYFERILFIRRGWQQQTPVFHMPFLFNENPSAHWRLFCCLAFPPFFSLFIAER